MGNFILDLVGAQSQADTENQQGDFAAKLSRINQGLDAQRGQAALAQGNYLAGQARMRGSQTLGAQTNAYAAGGVDSGYGTAASTGLSTKAMADMDAMILQNNAARQAWGYKVQGLQDKWQGQLGQWSDYDKAQASLVTGGINASSDFVSFVGGAAGAGRGVGASMGGSGGAASAAARNH